MTMPGTVSFDVPRDAALHAALWILHYGGIDRQSGQWPWVKRIGDRLFRSWIRRGRPRTITVTLSRAEARWIGATLSQIVAPMIIGGEDPILSDAQIVGIEARRRLHRRRGRPALSRAAIMADQPQPERTRFRHKAWRKRIEAMDRARMARHRWLRPSHSTILSAE